jgi:hypothetical protein
LERKGREDRRADVFAGFARFAFYRPSALNRRRISSASTRYNAMK